MTSRIAKTRHLGERRFVEYPQMLADELGLTGDFADSFLGRRLSGRHQGRSRRVLGLSLLLLAALACALLLLR